MKVTKRVLSLALAALLFVGTLPCIITPAEASNGSYGYGDVTVDGNTATVLTRPNYLYAYADVADYNAGNHFGALPFKDRAGDVTTGTTPTGYPSARDNGNGDIRWGYTYWHNQPRYETTITSVGNSSYRINGTAAGDYESITTSLLTGKVGLSPYWRDYYQWANVTNNDGTLVWKPYNKDEPADSSGNRPEIVKTADVKRNMLAYMSAVLKSAWALYDSKVGKVTANGGTTVPAFGSVDVYIMMSFGVTSEGTTHNDEGWYKRSSMEMFGTSFSSDQYTGPLYAWPSNRPSQKYTDSINPSAEEIVKAAFGDKVWNAINTKDVSSVSSSSLTYEERSIIRFLYACGCVPGGDSDGMKDYVTQLLKSDADIENERAAAVTEFLGKTPESTLEYIRWVAYYWKDNLENIWSTDFSTTSDFLTLAKQIKTALNGSYTPKSKSWYVDGVKYSSFGTSVTELADAYAFMAFGARSNAGLDFSSVSIQSTGVAMPCPFTLTDVTASLEVLKQFKESAPGAQVDGTVVQAVDIWPHRYKVAVAVMCNLIDSSNLKYIEISSNNTVMSILPPSFVETGSYFSSYNIHGFAAVMLVAQDLTRMSYDIVNYLAPIVDSENPTFRGYEAEILATQSLYQCFVLAADNNLWPIWNTVNFDYRTSAGTNGKMSMGQLYDWLQAHDMFSLHNDYTVDSTKPFTYFFDTSTMRLSGFVSDGITLSAQFIPMRTNVYDPYTWIQSGADTEWLLNFYLKFGYYRKALYIDTNPDAAVNFVNTGGKGKLAVATLRDLLEEKDIVLYIDENLYNVKEISDLIGMSWDRIGQDSQSSTLGAWDSFTSAVSGLWSVSMVELAKTAERNTYSTRVGYFYQGDNEEQADNKWNKFFMPIGGDEWEELREAEGSSIGDVDTIAKYLYADQLLNEDGVLKNEYEQVEYSYMVGFAVLSGIYRDTNLLASLNGVYSGNHPVFMASDTAPFISEEYKTAIYNWMLVRNLEAQMTVDYQSSLDMEAPLYMDIFGNILTESGYVVVPAAANATLFRANEYEPYNAALCTTYGDAYRLPVDNTSSASKVNQMLKGCFGEEQGVWVLRNIMTVDGSVNLAKLSVGSKDSLQALADTFAYSMQSSQFYNISFWEMLITEVLRGAPIEYIDKEFEGIQTNITYTKAGLIIADKLEMLVDALSSAGQNAAIAIPNPAYMDGIEIIVFFVFKLLILLVLVIWMVTIYFDATGGQLSLRTAGKCIGVVIMVLALVVGVPKIFELTYYESNKYLLQNETEYLMMLNLEKRANGEEIGVSSVSVPKTNTKLYLYLSDVEMPWWDLLTSIATSAGYSSLDEMYRNYEYQHPLAYSEQATTINGSVYIDTDTLFDSARVAFSSNLNTLYVTATSSTPASYYTPYYYFLEQIVNEVTIWSKANNYIAYTTKLQRGGQLRTLGYCQAFFESPEFLEEGNDFFNLYALYDVLAPREYKYLPMLINTESGGDYTAAEQKVDALRNSQWCAYGVGSEKATQARIEELMKFAQAWVANNRGMIGKVSDETFLKCFALACAMEHNRIFNTQHADYLEIQEVSNEDLLRLSIADHNDVMSSSTMSYARFVYTQGGNIAVYLAAILEIVNFISAWVKPLCTMIVFVLAVGSIFVLKLILRRNNNSVYGYVVTIALMCSVNVLGALATKALMYIPRLGFTTSVNILAVIIVQVLYMVLQYKIVMTALKDYRNIGFQRHQSAVQSFNFFGSRDRNLSRDVSTPRMSNGWDYYNALSNRQLNRRRRA